MVKKSYKEHTLHHTERLFYWCGTCKSNLSTRKAYQKHKKVKTEDLFNCDHCDQVFCNNYMFKRHLHTIHTYNDGPPYNCTECPALFQNVSKFEAHSNIHHGKFTCDVCYEKLQSKRCLERHKTTHAKDDLISSSPKMKQYENVTKYICNVCPSIFEKNYELKLHKSSHKTSCDTCPRTFRSRLDLVRHAPYCAVEHDAKVKLYLNGIKEESRYQD